MFTAMEGKTYREWLVPADVINSCSSLRVVGVDEEDEFYEKRWER